MKVLKDEQVDRNKWINFLQNNPYATPFQTREYYDLFNSMPSFSARVYAIEGQNELSALCVVTLQKEKGIKGYFSRRAIIYGGPLIKKDDINTLEELLKGIKSDLKSDVIYIEIRNYNDYSPYKESFNKNGWKYIPYLNYELDCSGEEVVWNNLSSNRRRQIKKGLKQGATIEEANNEEDISQLYTILQKTYREKVKKPLFPLSFFIQVFRSKISKIFLIRQNSVIIGGAICPVLEGRVIFDWFRCGLDQEYKNESPSILAAYAGLKYGYENGYKKYDFMGAGKPNEEYGVRTFKSEFGGVLVEHGRFLNIVNPALYKLGETALKLLKKK